MISIVLATCIFISCGYNRFSSGFNFPLYPSPSVPCKNRERPPSCALSPKKVFHILIRSAKKDILDYPSGNVPLTRLGWKKEKERHLEVEALLTWAGWTAIKSEPLNCQRISSLLLSSFSTSWEKTCYIFTLHPGRLDSMLFQLDNHLWNVCPKLIPMLAAGDTTLEALSAQKGMEQ